MNPPVRLRVRRPTASCRKGFILTVETLHQAIHAVPFRPFALLLADGRSLPVPHPDFVAFNSTGRVAVVMDELDGAEYVDLLLVVSLSIEGKPVEETATR